jgi:hypothetical protein
MADRSAAPSGRSASGGGLAPCDAPGIRETRPEESNAAGEVPRSQKKFRAVGREQRHGQRQQ